MQKELVSAYWALRIGIGSTALVAGLDKYLNLLTDWTQYLSPLATAVVPLAPDTIMQVVGVVEMAVGLAILTALPRLGAYIASAWLLAIALNLVTTGRYFDIAVRDVVMSIAAYALARLAEVYHQVAAAEGFRTQARSTIRTRA